MAVRASREFSASDSQNTESFLALRNQNTQEWSELGRIYALTLLTQALSGFFRVIALRFFYSVRGLELQAAPQ